MIDIELESKIAELKTLIKEAKEYGVDEYLLKEAEIELSCLMIKAGEQTEKELKNFLNLR